MSVHDFRDRLAGTGLDDGVLGAAETLSFPAATVDEARAPIRESPSPDDFGAPRGAVRELPLAVRSDVLGAIGLAATLDRAAGRLAFHAPADLPFVLDPAPAAEGFATNAPAEFLIATAVTGSTGAEPLAFGSISASGLRLQGLHAWPAPPLDAWRAAAGDAEWHVLAEHAGASRWQDTLIAGRIARLLQPLDAPPLIAARTWSRTLSPGQRGLIERYATVAARQLTIRLERLQSTIVPDEPGLVDRWRRLCHDRDDLEGIRVLLREAKAGDALAAALREGDAVGRALHFSWPSTADVHDERLQRVAEGDPGAWWAGTRRRAFVL
jgi:hypothetical protein